MRTLPFLLLTANTLQAFSQTPDSLYHQLPQAEIKFSTQNQRLRLLSSEGTIDTGLISKTPVNSIISAVNTVPGVRMEERSPGSYRLSMRGSLLRSPFGVRNVKIYLGDFPLTDAGGNTYLSSLDFSNVHSLRILKGPESSIFGANTGGVLLIDAVPHPADSLTAKIAVSGGSYGLFYENAAFQKRWKKAEFTFTQAYQRSDGYRENSGMQKHFVQLAHRWDYHSKMSLKALLVFSDLHYQTPGGLTLQQYEQNPAAARFPTATLPGAVAQKAAIYNRTVFGGISNEFRISAKLKHVISIFGSHTDFKNPFITNYEVRAENTIGARTYLDLGIGRTNRFSAKFNVGAEWQQTNSQIENFTNNQGNKGNLAASDDIHARQGFVFVRALADLYRKVLIEGSLSANLFNYSYRNNFPVQEAGFSTRNFNPQLMAGMSASWTISNLFSWRASVRNGYSAPTIAEVRSSDNIVNTALEAENGTSYETGFRLRGRREIIKLDASVFYFELKNAIVRRLNDDGTEYFINAGGTSQPGIEAQISLDLIRPEADKWIRSLQLTGNMTYSQFSFKDYRVAGNDFSGKSLTGVPRYTSTESISIGFPLGFSLYAQYYYASEIPLNDGNSVFADAYHLVQTRIEWKKPLSKLELTFFAGIDNLLDQKYSLGNDLNAAGNRYYNAAAPRNYYGGIKAQISKFKDQR